MTEGESNLFEMEPEHIPTEEEVHSVFKELAEKEYKEERRLEDEMGLYLLEVVAAGESEGETVEYAYMRKGRYSQLAEQVGASVTAIHATHYQDGMPISGTCVAEYIDGKWSIL